MSTIYGPVKLVQNKATIKLNHLGRFYIEHDQKSYLAWSIHQRWVPHWKGVATNVGICNFATDAEARNYANGAGLKVD